MSIDSKIRLMNNLKTALSSSLTINEVDTVLSVLLNEMKDYEVNYVPDKNVDDNDMLKSYLGALRIEGRSAKTIKRYNYIINRMFTKVNLRTSDITVHDIRNYFINEKERGISDRTLDGERQVFNGYFGWLQREGIIKKNPISNIGAIKYKKKVKDLFSEVDVELMKSACSQIRDKAIIMFLLSTGVRVSEMLKLNRDSINLYSLECKVLGKGNKERIVYLDEVTAMFIKQYFDERTDDCKSIFIGRRCNCLTPNGVRNMLKRVEKKSGVVNVHPHKFRRTLATNLIKRGMPIEKVAAVLGHDKIDTTMQYVILDNSDVKNAYRKCA